MHLPQTTVFGVATLQDWSDLALWELFLNDHPDLKCIIEIGTYAGGLSLFLQQQAAARGIRFATCDIERYPSAAIEKLGTNFIQADALTDETIHTAVADPGNHPLLIYCDGGDKPAEFAHFVPLLQPGDFIGVHDYGSEFTDADAQPFADLLRPAAVERHRQANSLTRFYRRVAQGGWGSIGVGVRISKYPEPAFFCAWTALLTGGLRSDDTVLLPATHMPAHWAADALVREFIKSGRDTLLLVDDDMTFTPDTLKTLREHEANWQYDIITAVATHRSWPPTPVIMQLQEQPIGPEARKGEFFKTVTDWTPGEVVPVDACGLAFTLIRRNVLTEMADKAYNLDLNYWFHYGPGNESDDIPFCRRARNMGFRLGVDTSIELGHIAAVPLTAENWRGFQAQRALVQEGYRADVDGDKLAEILRWAIDRPAQQGLPGLDSNDLRLRHMAQTLLEVIRA